MNDIDLRVAPEQAIAACELLEGAGCERSRAYETSLEHTLAYDRHLRQLTSADGTVVELHMRCWARHHPRPREKRLLARARTMGPDDSSSTRQPRTCLRTW
jgi:hypothetical protein